MDPWKTHFCDLRARAIRLIQFGVQAEEAHRVGLTPVTVEILGDARSALNPLIVREELGIGGGELLDELRERVRDLSSERVSSQVKEARD
jgi:hypothetical protein